MIRQAKCYRSGEWILTDVRVDDGIITSVGDRLPTGDEDEIVEANGKTLLPGLIDVHVHLREPGFEEKETIASGSRAAARGGFTTIAAMPNTEPVTDTADLVREQYRKAGKEAVVNVHFYGAITEGLRGEELTDFQALKEAGAFALTDDGVGIQSAGQMLAAMERAKEVGLTVVAHCEDNSLADRGVMHDGEKASRLGLPGIPAEAEAAHIVRDALLAERTGVHYHVCHVSSAASVQAIREAKQRGVHMTAEVTPHHLVLTEDDIPGDNALYKMNPPLRSARDRSALMAGLLDGTIDFIATDHAPHETAAKRRGFRGAPFGVIGLETAFPLLYTRLVLTGFLTLEQLVKRMSTAPAACFGLPGGVICEGAQADLTLVDLEREETVDPAAFYSKSENTPFCGWRLTGWPVWTMVGGQVVYDEAQGGITG
nr:dihydroorotase [Novibacillus thermophilus]